MKRFLSTILAIASIVAFATSCNNNKIGTYEFFVNSVIHVSDQDLESQISAMIDSDSYFCKKNTYTANLSEAVEHAANEFAAHVEKLDWDSVESQMGFNDYVELSLWCMNPGNCYLTYYVTPTGSVSQK